MGMLADRKRKGAPAVKEAPVFKKTGLLTRRSVREIEDIIVSNVSDTRRDLWVPNVSWGFFNEHEADLVRVTPAGILTEYEIKRSWTDFLADFKKPSYHDDSRIGNLYYVVPQCMAEECARHICPDEKSQWAYHAGVLCFEEHNPLLKEVLPSNCPGYGKRKLYIEEVLNIAKLGVMRYWALRRKEDDARQQRKETEKENNAEEIIYERNI